MQLMISLVLAAQSATRTAGEAAASVINQSFITSFFFSGVFMPKSKALRRQMALAAAAFSASGMPYWFLAPTEVSVLLSVSILLIAYPFRGYSAYLSAIKI